MPRPAPEESSDPIGVGPKRPNVGLITFIWLIVVVLGIVYFKHGW